MNFNAYLYLMYSQVISFLATDCDKLEVVIYDGTFSCKILYSLLKFGLNTWRKLVPSQLQRWLRAWKGNIKIPQVPWPLLFRELPVPYPYKQKVKENVRKIKIVYDILPVRFIYVCERWWRVKIEHICYHDVFAWF